MTYDDGVSLSMSKGTDLFYDAAPDCWQRLAGAMIVQAARDANRGSVEAQEWLVDPETSNVWFFLAGMDQQAALRWGGRGCKVDKKIKRSVKANRVARTRVMR